MSIFAEGNEHTLSKTCLWGMQTLRGAEQPPAEPAVALSQKTGRVSPWWNNRTCRTPCGVLPHPASPGEPLAVKPQDSLTNTEERLMCHGMSAKLSLPCAKPFSAKPEPAMVMEISPFLSLSSKNAISTALQKWSSQLWTIHGFPRRKSYSLMTSLVSWAH